MSGLIGLTHVYCGDGKGKTTAAVGLAIRAAGSGKRVVFCQFMKCRKTSEINILEKINGITILRHNEDFGFYRTMDNDTKKRAKEAYSLLLKKAIRIANSFDNCVAIFDEITYAWEYNFICRDELISFVKNKKLCMEIVFTGRNPDNFFIDNADYISEIVKKRHPYDKGIYAREGIEY